MYIIFYEHLSINFYEQDKLIVGTMKYPFLEFGKESPPAWEE